MGPGHPRGRDRTAIQFRTSQRAAAPPSKSASIALFRRLCQSGAAMTLELEGDLSLERAHTRRWVSIIAVVIPVAAFVLLGVWFIRVYIAPPTVAIPSPMMWRTPPPPPVAVPKRAMVEAPPPPLPMAEPAADAPEPEQNANRVSSAADVCHARGGAAGIPQSATRLCRSRARCAVRADPDRPHSRRTRRDRSLPSQSPVRFRCRGQSRTALSRRLPMWCHYRGPSPPRLHPSRSFARSTATRSISEPAAYKLSSATPSRRRSRSAPAQILQL